MSPATPLDQQSVLRSAIALHRQGALDDAEARYLAVLHDDPIQFDALHLLGVLARQRGDPVTSIALIRRALAVDATQAGAYCNLGVALQDCERSAEAIDAFEHAIVLQPDHSLALNNLGNALRKVGRSDDAAARYRQALASNPGYAEAHYHLGLTLQADGEHFGALECLERALALQPEPGHAEGWCATGVSLHALQRYAQAVDSYDRALRIKPNYVEALCNRGLSLQRLGASEQAFDDFDRAIALRPRFARVHEYRANLLRDAGRVNEAIAALRQALALGSDAQQIAFQLAALGAGGTPRRAPEDYVRELFDQYAGHFDRHLLEQLDYTLPRQLGTVLARHLMAERVLDVLDLGCGTGLCASYCQQFARSLRGVDLSPRMLDKARALGIYDDLHCAEACSFLRASSATFDLIVAADVVVYFGDLQDLFSAASNALRPGGLFVFSIEAGAGAEYALGATHRYAHSLKYVRDLAQRSGFLAIEDSQCAGREEGGRPVAAYLVVLKLPAVAASASD